MQSQLEQVKYRLFAMTSKLILSQAFRSPRNPSPSPEPYNTRRRPTRGRARGRKFDASKLAAPLPALPVRLDVPMDGRLDVPMDGSTAAGTSIPSPMANGASTAGASVPSSMANGAAPQSGPRAPRVGEPQPPETHVHLGVDASRGPEERLLIRSHYSWTRVIAEERATWAKYLDQLAVYYRCARSDYANEYHVSPFPAFH